LTRKAATSFLPIEARVQTQSVHQITMVARAMAEAKLRARLPWRAAMRRKSLSRLNVRSTRSRALSVSPPSGGARRIRPPRRAVHPRPGPGRHRQCGPGPRQTPRPPLPSLSGSSARSRNSRSQPTSAGIRSKPRPPARPAAGSSGKKHHACPHHPVTGIVGAFRTYPQPASTRPSSSCRASRRSSSGDKSLPIGNRGVRGPPKHGTPRITPRPSPQAP